MFSSVQFSHSVVSDSFRPRESQHARPPCPSPTPGVHSDSRPSVSDAIQPSHPLSSPSPAPNPSQHQNLKASATINCATNVCISVQFSSVGQLCPTLCNPMNPSMPGLPVLIIYSYIIISLYHSFINALFTNNYNATLMMLLMLFIFQFSKIFLLAKQKICYLL